jgi:hypothetical protein
VGPRDLLIHVARFLESIGAQYFVTGSMGAMVYGEFRMTQDVDIVVDLRYGHVPDLLGRFGEPDYYVSQSAIREAMENCSQFNVIEVATGLKVDFMIPDESAFNASRFARARSVEIAPGERVRVSAPEDVILKKLEYFKAGASDKHLRDIASMIKISGETFDREYLERWARELGVEEEWRAARSRVGW